MAERNGTLLEDVVVGIYGMGLREASGLVDEEKVPGAPAFSNGAE